MPEERKTIEARLSASPEVYRHTKFMARFEKAFPWLLAGGAALVLLETYRKNTNNRAKANADIKAALKNQEHQAEVLIEQIRQFDENAFKERKTERRERYTKAVEQLGNASAPVRMGGVYTLIGLADEWLLDENLDYAEKVREGQVIVNNLCAYIRSPFTLASHYDEFSEDNPSLDGIYKDNQQKFYTDKAEFTSEADIRLSIIKEIHNRLQSTEINTPGAWSDFEYDFSGSTFFYPVDLTNSYYKNPLISVAPRTRAMPTSRAPLTRAGPISATPSTGAGLISAALHTRVRLTSAAPRTRTELLSTALPTQVGLISIAPPTGRGLLQLFRLSG